MFRIQYLNKFKNIEAFLIYITKNDCLQYRGKLNNKKNEKTFVCFYNKQLHKLNSHLTYRNHYITLHVLLTSLVLKFYKCSENIVHLHG